MIYDLSLEGKRFSDDALKIGLLDYSTEAALPVYDLYVRHFTLFRTSHFNAPYMRDISTITVPKKVTYHYVDTSGVMSGPSYSDPLIQAIPGIKSIIHVKELLEPEGSPIKVAGVNVEMLTTRYRRENRLIRPLTNPDRMERDERGVIIYNYSMLAQQWRYLANYKAVYTRISNLYTTLYRTMNQLLKTSERNQFIDLYLPDVIPPAAHLREYSRTLSSSSLKKIRTPEEMLIGDIFKYLGDMEGSWLSILDKSKADKVNFIVRRNSSWITINLGWLLEIKEKLNNPRLVQNKFLLLLNKLLDSSAIFDNEETEEEREEKLKKLEEPTEEVKQEEDDVGDLLNVSSGFIINDEESDAGLIDEEEELKKAEEELEELDKLKELSQAEAIVIGDGDEDEYLDNDVSKYDIDGYIRKNQDKLPIMAKADELLKKGALTPAAYKRLERASEKFELLANPYDGESSIIDYMTLTEEDLVIKPKVISDDEVVVDPEMRESKLDAFQEKYNSKIINKDLVASIAAIQNFPVAITDYKVEDKSTAMSGIEEHTFKVTPAIGQSSTIKMLIPIISPEGTFRYNSNTYRMRNQRADLPIRKISPTEVVLTSYASKCFVQRSELAVFNYERWMGKYLMSEATNVDSTAFTEPNIATVVVYNVRLPWHYNVISKTLAGFTKDKIKYSFDYKRRVKVLNLNDEDLKVEKDGNVIVAKPNKNVLYVMQLDGEVIKIKDGLEEPFTHIETILGTDGLNKPLPAADIKIFGKSIPLGVALSYLMGFEELIKVMRIKVRRALPGERLNLEPYEFEVRFRNETIIFDGRDRRTVLIMSGWRRVRNFIKNYDLVNFNDPEVYIPILERINVNARFVRELDSMNNGFIDPMTLDILKSMGEPTNFLALLIRAVEMIVDNYVPSKIDDPKKQVELTERVRGYERVPGMVYETLYKAMRQYSVMANRSDSKVVVNPVEVLNNVISDPTVSIENNINPLHSLREREVITFGGRGGRSKKAMVARTRLYTEEDQGWISEATVDSGDVGIISYMTPNANISTVRGTVRLFDKKKDSTTNLFSSSAQLMPAVDGDD